MILDPPQTIACPRCGGLATYCRMVSGNTLGAKVWTDGFMDAPMLMPPPVVAKCPDCQHCYWLERAPKVAKTDHFLVLDSRAVEEPEERDYYRLLRQGFATDLQQERTLRTLAWWRSNDAHREGFVRPPRLSEGFPGPWHPVVPPDWRRKVSPGRAVRRSAACRENLEQLARLMDEADPADRLMKAELSRELGQFEAALQILGSVATKIPGLHAARIRQLCEAGDVAVRLCISDTR